ncbi:MAG: hypothetical protein ACRCXZ_03775 [Patescibacteria group bacterium]
MSSTQNPKNQVKVVSFYCDREETWYMIYKYPNSNEPNRSYRLVLESYLYPTLYTFQDIARGHLGFLTEEDHIHVRELKLKAPQKTSISIAEPFHYMTSSNDKSLKQKIASSELDYLINLFL